MRAREDVVTEIRSSTGADATTTRVVDADVADAFEACARGGARAWARATHALCRRAAAAAGEATDARVGAFLMGGLEMARRDGASDDAVRSRLSGARVLGALGARGRDAVRELVERACKDPAACVRRACAEALGRVGGLTAADVKSLGKALGDRQEDVRTAATRAVGALGGDAKSLVDKLTPNAKSSDPELRQATCEALENIWKGRQGDPAPDGSDDVRLFQTAECAGELTNDADAGVRAAATRCLGHLRGAAAAKISLIHKRVDDPDEGVRDAAAEALIKLGFFNPNTGTLSRMGNYRKGKFSANKNLFAALSGAQEALGRVKIPIGGIVRVWWPLDECYYEARVKAYDKTTREHTLLYLDDKVEERVNLRKEKVDLRHKPSKNGRVTWIPCGMLPKKSKDSKSNKSSEEKKRKRSAAGARDGASGEWIEYDSDEQKRLGGAALVGKRIKVWWPLDKCFYAAEVRAHVPATGEHVVFYFEDSQEEALLLRNERVQLYVPKEGASVPSIHGLEPSRVNVRVGKKTGVYEPGCFRGAECISCVDDASGEYTTILCAEFDKMYGEPESTARRWRRSIQVVPARGAEPESIDKWLRAKGEQWGAAVVGEECVMDVNVDMRDFPSDKPAVEPIWQRVKIIAYSSTSGEHQVVDVKDDGETDPTRIVWLPLCMQRTKPLDDDDDDDDE